MTRRPRGKVPPLREIDRLMRSRAYIPPPAAPPPLHVMAKLRRDLPDVDRQAGPTTTTEETEI